LSTFIILNDLSTLINKPLVICAQVNVVWTLDFVSYASIDNVYVKTIYAFSIEIAIT